MACRHCYAKHVGKDIQDIDKWKTLTVAGTPMSVGLPAGEQKCPCSICGGTGYMIPAGPTTAGLFGGVTYPPCKHCDGTGWCEKNPW